MSHTFTVNPARSDPDLGFAIEITRTLDPTDTTFDIKEILISLWDTANNLPLGDVTLDSTTMVTDQQTQLSITTALGNSAYSFNNVKPCLVYFTAAGAVTNVVYDAMITIITTSNSIIYANATTVNGSATGRKVPLMLTPTTTPTFTLEKPLVLQNKRSLSVVLKTGNVPIKSVDFSVTNNGTTFTVQKYLYDANDSVKKYGVKGQGPLGSHLIELTQADLAGTGINLANNELTSYSLTPTVIPMNLKGVVTTPTSLTSLYAPNRINAPDFLSVQQVDFSSNDYTIECMFRPPSDFMALNSSGIDIVKYIFTDRPGDIAGSDVDNSGNLIASSSALGRFWFDENSNEYKDASGNITIAKKVGELTTAQLGTLSNGVYTKKLTDARLRQIVSNSASIGITAVGSDNTYSLTSYTNLNFGPVDSAPGMLVAPSRPSLLRESVDISGNLELEVQVYTRSRDISGNIELYKSQANGSGLTTQYYPIVTNAPNFVPVAGYNAERKYKLNLPLETFSNEVLGETQYYTIKAVDVSGNGSLTMNGFPYARQINAQKPKFSLREVNDLASGNTKLYVLFDSNGAGWTGANGLPALGLGARDASANQYVELSISTRANSQASWTNLNTQIVSNINYSRLSDATGIELSNITLLPGHELKLTGVIKTLRLSDSRTILVSDTSDAVTFTAVNLAKPVTDIVVVPTDISGNDQARRLMFTFNSPTSGAPLLSYDLDVFVNNFASPVYSASIIDASGIPLASNLPARNNKVILTSTGPVSNPAAHSGPRSQLTDASYNYNISGLNFTWGDLVKVKVSSVARSETRASDPAVAEVVMVPSAPARVTGAVITQDSSLNDIVTYTIENNGSFLASLTTMSVFWDNINEQASALVAPDMLSTFTFASSTIGSTPTDYTINAATYPSLALVNNRANNIIDPNYNVFTGTIGRAGSVVPASSTFGVKYLTGPSKTNANGSTNSLAGLKAAFSVLTGQNQKTNRTQTLTDYRLISTQGPV